MSRWSDEQDDELRAAHELQSNPDGTVSTRRWKYIAECISGGKNVDMCKARWSWIDPTVDRSVFTKEDDALIWAKMKTHTPTEIASMMRTKRTNAQVYNRTKTIKCYSRLDLVPAHFIQTRGRKWSTADNAAIETMLSNHVPINKILVSFPDRSQSAVKRRIHRRTYVNKPKHLRRAVHPWSAAEDAMLTEMVAAFVPLNQVLEAMPIRTRSALRVRMSKLGITYRQAKAARMRKSRRAGRP